MRFKVTITLKGCTDLQGNPLKSVIRLEADSAKSAKEQGLKIFKLSLPAKAVAVKDEDPCYD